LKHSSKKEEAQKPLAERINKLRKDLKKPP